jgi:hypothetical protein
MNGKEFVRSIGSKLEENMNRLLGELCVVGRIILKYFYWNRIGGCDLDSCGSG